MGKNLSNKYSQNLLYSPTKIYKKCNKTASKRAIQKRSEVAGDLIGNRIDYKITSVSTELHSENSAKELQNNEQKRTVPVRSTYQKKDTYIQKKYKKLFMN